MPFINTKTGELNKSLWDVRLAYQNISFPAHVEQHEEFLFYEESSQPEYDPLTQDCVEIMPVGGLQQWEVRNVSAEEAEARRRAQIPSVVTMRQARLALLQAGKLDDIEALVASLGKSAQLEWEYAAVVERSTPLIDSIGLTSAELDELFILAASL